METFEREVLDRLKTIEIKLDGYGELKAKVYENERELLLLKNDLSDTKAELKDQREESRWLKRTVIAAIITGIVGIVFLFLRAGMGV
jgi:aminoglycoside phosphotransferase